MDNNTMLGCMQIRNETETAAELYIHGDIIDDYWKNWLSDWDGNTNPGYVLPVDVRDQLKALDGKTLTVYINSDGGSVPAGIAIANMIARHSGRTIGVIDGWAASAASVIFLSCDELHMPVNTFLMIHKPVMTIQGNADDLLRGIDVLDTIQAGIEKTYQAKAREDITPDRIHAAVDAETWYTAEEAAAVFDIIVDDTPVQLMACSTRITDHMPEAVRNAKRAAEAAANTNIRQEADRRRRKIACEMELFSI